MRKEKKNPSTSRSPAHSSPLTFLLREWLERWSDCSVCELRRQPAHSRLPTSDVCSTLTSRGHSLPLQPPLSLLISAAFSAGLSNFLLRACLLGNVSHSERICWLCNTLIYALSLFLRRLLCVKWALYFYPEKPKYRFWCHLCQFIHLAGWISAFGRNVSVH